MGNRRTWLLLAFVCLAGCNRQDTECLSRIGKKVMDRASSATAGVREKLPSINIRDSLHERVSSRLRWDKALAEVPIEVVAHGKEIELKGKVKTEEQRNRAVELAEATAGVERVLVSLTMEEK